MNMSLKAKMILVKLVMVDLHLQMDDTHTSSKLYDLDTDLDLKKGFSKQELEDAMKGHILAEAKLTGTFAS